MEELTRRDFLRLTAGGGVYLAGGFGQKSVEKLIPYVIPPEDIKPGEWTIYATTCRECPAAVCTSGIAMDGSLTLLEIRTIRLIKAAFAREASLLSRAFTTRTDSKRSSAVFAVA